MQKRAPRITDVAKLAGVSTATVSRALSKPDTVAESTRNTVLAAARESGYRVNLSARNLRRQRTGAIVVMVPDLGNPFFSRILSGIEEGLSESRSQHAGRRHTAGAPEAATGFEPPACHPRRRHYRTRRRIARLRSVSATLSAFRRAADHLCLRVDAADRFPSVRVDNEHGARLAISHLADLGHRSIGMICGPKGNVLTSARSQGAAAEMAARNLALDPMHVFDGDFSIDAGAEAAAAHGWSLPRPAQRHVLPVGPDGVRFHLGIGALWISTPPGMFPSSALTISISHDALHSCPDNSASTTHSAGACRRRNSHPPHRGIWRPQLQTHHPGCRADRSGQHPGVTG
jgi:hypothetical protein